jgi:MFS family permease
VVRVWPADPETKAWLEAPRDDLVAEAATGAGGVFVQADGPFVEYERRLERQGDTTRETTRWRLSVPWFAWLFRWPVRRHLSSRRPEHDPAGRQPWWAPPDRLNPRQARILGLLAAASLASAFINTLFTQTVNFAAAEFDVSEGGQGIAGAVVRLGVVLALPITVLADHIGRRRAILLTAWAAPMVSALGALAPSFPVLVATQTVGRPLGLALDIVVAVVAAEEMPRGSRAYAVSLLAMANGLGAGVAVWALPLADLSVQSWRLIYLLALVWLVVAVDLTRRLPETDRFIVAQHRAAARRMRVRARLDRHRLGLLALVAFCVNLFVATASIFQNRFLDDERGYSATLIALFTVCTATPAGIGLVVGGRLADTRGRRVMAGILMPLGAVLLATSFATYGAAMWAAAAVGAVVSGAAYPALAVYHRELFPTAGRGRAGGLLTASALLGGAIGLVAGGQLLDAGWSYGTVMGLFALGPTLGALLVVTRYPETAHRELEELNPEDALLEEGASGRRRRRSRHRRHRGHGGRRRSTRA